MYNRKNILWKVTFLYSVSQGDRVYFCTIVYVTTECMSQIVTICNKVSEYILVFHSMSQNKHNSTSEYVRICPITPQHVIVQHIVLWCLCVSQYKAFFTFCNSVLCYVTMNHGMSQCVILFHSESCYVTMNHDMSQCVTLCHSVTCHVTVCHVMSQCVILCHSVSCYITGCHVMSQCVMFCHSVSCYVIVKDGTCHSVSKCVTVYYSVIRYMAVGHNM